MAGRTSRNSPPAPGKVPSCGGRPVFRRTFQACNNCRKSKARCDLGGGDLRDIYSFSGPPCARCRRQHLDCVFEEERSSHSLNDNGNKSSVKRRRIDPTATVQDSYGAEQHSFDLSADAISESDVPAPAGLSPQQEPQFQPRTSKRHSSSHRHERGRYASKSRAGTDPGMSATSDRVKSKTQYHGPRSDADGGDATAWATPGAHRDPKDDDVADSLMRTVLATGNGPLDVLLQSTTKPHQPTVEAGGRSYGRPCAELQTISVAATAQRTPSSTGYGPTAADARLSSGDYAISHVAPSTANDILSAPALASTDPDVLALWKGSKFVRTGLMSAQQAINYIDGFFKHLSPLSPILTSFYSNHKNHTSLLQDEPLLCATILMISSRYHMLPSVSPSARSRSRFVHQELWNHCQKLITRIMFGQEARAGGGHSCENSKLRNLGSIEALLLITEWYPQANNFPGMDAELAMIENDIPCSLADGGSDNDNWLDDMVESTKRSDRMAWMLLGSAQLLAHEIGIFEARREEHVGGVNDASRSSKRQPKDVRNNSRPTDENDKDDGRAFRKRRIRELLCIYMTILAARLGIFSMTLQSLDREIVTNTSKVPPTSTTLAAWIELVKIAKFSSENLFRSSGETRELLRSGRYIDLLEHLRPVLEQWRQKYLVIHSDHHECDTEYQSEEDAQQRHLCEHPSYHQDVLFIEYNHVRMFINSPALQAVAERIVQRKENSSLSSTTLDLVMARFSSDPTVVFDDHGHVATAGGGGGGGGATDRNRIEQPFLQDVLDSATDMIEHAIGLSDDGDQLRYFPGRTFLRVMGACVFLLKAFIIGIRRSRQLHILDLLDRCACVLKKSAIDDVHPAGGYALLLERHTARLRSSEARVGGRSGAAENMPSEAMDAAAGVSGGGGGSDGVDAGGSLSITTPLVIGNDSQHGNDDISDSNAHDQSANDYYDDEMWSTLMDLDPFGSVDFGREFSTFNAFGSSELL